jgi:hypothetical protein
MPLSRKLRQLLVPVCLCLLLTFLMFILASAFPSIASARAKLHLSSLGLTNALAAQQPKPGMEAQPGTAQSKAKDEISKPGAPQGNGRDCPEDTTTRDAWLVRTFCFLAATVVIYPILRFLFKPWTFRREHIFGALAGDAVVYYYLKFRPGAKLLQDHPPSVVNPYVPPGPVFEATTAAAYLEAFKKDFERWYGRGYYIIPVFLLTVLSFASAWWAEMMLRYWAANSRELNSLRALAAAALGGAFMWIVSDQIDRLRRRDFTTSDVYYYNFRILMAIPFAWALSLSEMGASTGHPLGLAAAIPLAFFLGAFPTTTLFTVARRIGGTVLKLGDDPDKGNELEKLQSVTKSNAERFKDEGIATITSLAYADPVDLTIRTNFDFSYVVDCVSQALMWIYLGKDDGGAQLFPLSLRGAQEVRALFFWLNDASDAVRQAAAQKTIDEAAVLLKISSDALRVTLEQIAEDPYTKFLTDVWT